MFKNMMKMLIIVSFILNTSISGAYVSAIQTLASAEFVKTQFEHDLQVSVEAPEDLLLGHPVLLKANATNLGLVDEFGVTFLLRINGTIVASKTTDLAVDSSDTVSYTWTPILKLDQIESPNLIKEVSYMYNITAYAVPVSGETYTGNNIETRMVQVWNPTVYVEPQHVERSFGETFVLSVKVANLTDKTIPHPQAPTVYDAPVGNLYGVDIEFSWDPTILEYMDRTVTIPVEDYLSGVLHEPIVPITDVVDAAAGTYHLAQTSMVPALSFNGQGTVFNITFRVAGRGGCHLRLVSTDLAAKKPPAPSPVIFHARSGSLFESAGIPIAEFTHWPLDAAAINKSVRFDADASYDPDGYIDLYMWDFGDGTKKNTTDIITLHNYTEAKTYEVVLTVLDNEGSRSVPTTKSLVVVSLRNLAVKSVEISSPIIFQSLTLTISVEVKNEGDITESFTVSAYYNNTAVNTETQWVEIGKKDVVNLESATSKPLKLRWNTTGVCPEVYYYILVNASIAPHEGFLGDNSLLCPDSVLVTAELRHDVSVKGIEIKPRADNEEFNVPVILGEDAIIRVEVKANGTVSEIFNASLVVIAPNRTVLLTKTWENAGLDVGETKELEYLLKAKEYSYNGNYTVDVNVTIIEEDADLADNFMERTFRIIKPPVLVIAELSPHIYVEETTVFDATASYHPDGEIVEFKWTFYHVGSLVRVEFGPSVNYTFDSPGFWEVVLSVKDNYGFGFHQLRPSTELYRETLAISVEGKPWALSVEMLYVIVGVVVVVVVVVLTYLRFRKRKLEAQSA